MKSICFHLQLIQLAFFMAFLGSFGLSKTAFAEELGQQHNLFNSFALQHATSSVDASSSNAAAPEFAAIATKAAAVRINVDFFEASRTMRPGDTILMDLFDGERASLEIQAVETDVNHVTAMRGNIQGSAWDFFYISIDGDKMFLTLDNAARKFEVVFNRQAGGHTLYEIPQERIKVPAEDLPPIVPPANRGKLSTETSAESTPDPNEEVTIDVMVVYTPATKAWADSNGGGINNVISQAITRGQQALGNSNTSLNIHLVHSAEVDYTESDDTDASSIDLSRLRDTSDGYMDDVHAWRNIYGADLVAMLVNGDYTGIGYSLMEQNMPYGIPDWAFSVIDVEYAASRYSYIHELGHNMGAGHHKNQIDTPDGDEGQPGPQLYSYSAGWRWTGSDSGRYCSIMTYQSGQYFSDGQTHSRVPYFSNPNISHFGAAIGNAADGDNARTLRETKHLTAKYRSSPAERAVRIAAGDSHTVFIQNDGSLWVWGNGNIPARIGTKSDWNSITAGTNYTVAVKADNNLWGWGGNEYGQLGDGTTENKITGPVCISATADWQTVAAGPMLHTVALKTDGSLWSWGLNCYGQLGDGSTENKHSPARIGTENSWQVIAAGAFHTIALKNDGSLWAWGNNCWGQLGDGTTEDKHSPVQIGTDNNWQAVTAGWSHAIALKRDGTLWGWGARGGNGTNEERHSPAQIGTDKDWQTVAAGSGHNTIALKKDGSLWAWGGNRFGQLGDGTTEDKFSPMPIGTDKDWQAVAAGSGHTIALKKDGSLWAWGQNGYGELGDGTRIERHTPVRVIFTSNSDTDSDGIDDSWEMTYFHNLTTANATSDADKDCYSDKKEYLNWLANETDPDGTVYDPTAKNAPGGTGYVVPVPVVLPAIYKLLLKH